MECRLYLFFPTMLKQRTHLFTLCIWNHVPSFSTVLRDVFLLKFTLLQIYLLTGSLLGMHRHVNPGLRPVSYILHIFRCRPMSYLFIEGYSAESISHVQFYLCTLPYTSSRMHLEYNSNRKNASGRTKAMPGWTTFGASSMLGLQKTAFPPYVVLHAFLFSKLSCRKCVYRHV